MKTSKLGNKSSTSEPINVVYFPKIIKEYIPKPDKKEYDPLELSELIFRMNKYKLLTSLPTNSYQGLPNFSNDYSDQFKKYLPLGLIKNNYQNKSEISDFISDDNNNNQYNTQIYNAKHDNYQNNDYSSSQVYLPTNNYSESNFKNQYDNLNLEKMLN
jgi:hypothetical protein